MKNITFTIINSQKTPKHTHFYIKFSKKIFFTLFFVTFANNFYSRNVIK